MKGTLSSFIMFATGAAIGSVVTWKLVKTKYERLVDKEIEEMREYFTSRQSEPVQDDTCTEPKKTSEREVLETLIAQNGYVNYSDASVKDEETENVTQPYIISPENYGEHEDYKLESLVYYEADKVLTYDSGEPVEDVAGMVGVEFSEHFGEYTEDVVHIRNDEQRTDYEILLDLGAYDDLITFNPFSTEDE